MTTIDSNGIIRYEDTDGAPTPPVLNLGLQSVSDAMARKGFYTAVDKADRNAYAAAFAPTDAKPLLVNRRDMPTNARWEWTNDGSTWYPLNSYPIIFTNTAATPGPFNSSGSIAGYPLAAVAYSRRLVINGGIYADISAGSWLGGLSVGVDVPSAAQRKAQFASGSRYSSVALSLTYILPANVSTIVRLWVERTSASGNLLTVNDPRLNYLDIQTYVNAGN